MRAKVAEYAEKIEGLEKRHELTMQMWSRYARILLGLECPVCHADIVAWREAFHEEHHCPLKIPHDSLITELKKEGDKR